MSADGQLPSVTRGAFAARARSIRRTKREALRSMSPETILPPASSVVAEIVIEHRRRDDRLRAAGNMARLQKSIERRMTRAAYVVLVPTVPLPPESSDTPVDCGAAGLISPETQWLRAGGSAPLNGVEAGRSGDVTPLAAACLDAPSIDGDGGDLATAVTPFDPGSAIAADIAFETREIRVVQRYLKAAQRQCEKRLTKLVQQHPVWHDFAEPICGFGAIGLGQIIGEAGDLSNYANPAKLWKRFGVGLVNGERQRKSLDKEKALAFGYNPRRRSVLHVIGDSLIKKQNPYRELYLQRKEYEKAKATQLAPMAHHLRALRYVEKRLLRDLWRAWTAPRAMSPSIPVPSAPAASERPS
jgi:hypothetical protein